jgi:hypothetical protein
MRKARTSGRRRVPTFLPRLTVLEDRTLLAVNLFGPGGVFINSFPTIQGAVNAAAASGDTIKVDPGMYPEQVTIGKSLTLEGDGPNVIIQSPTTLTPDPLALRAVVELNNAAMVTINNMTIQGPVASGQRIDAGILVVGGATADVTNPTIADIAASPLSGAGNTGNAIQIGGPRGITTQVGTATITNDVITGYQKTGILVRGGSSATIAGSTVSGVGPTPVVAQNGIQIDLGATATIVGNTISGNEYTGTSGGGFGPDPTSNTQAFGILINSSPPVLPGGPIIVSNNTITDNDAGIFSSNPTAPTITISGNTVENNRFEDILLSQGIATVSNNTITGSNIGVAIIPFAGDTTNSEGTLISNNITNNGNGGLSFPGAGILLLNPTGATTTALLTAANFNRIVGNSVGLNNTTAATVDAINNWWGSNAGPGGAGSDTVSGPVTFNPWLVLQVTASPTSVDPGGVASVVASLTTNSSGMDTSALGHVPDGIPVSFAATLGGISPTASATVSGKAVATFTAGTLSGMATVFATVDNQTSSAAITIAPGTSLQVFLYQGPVSPRNTALDFIISDPTTRPHTLWIFWGDSNQPDILPLGVGAGTFFFQATHHYSIPSFRQHLHKPYTVTAFALAGSGPAQTLLAGSVVVFQYFPREVASFVNG